MAAKKLRGLAETASETDMAEFSFNVEVLRVSACGKIYAMAAKGKPWDIPYSITASKLDFLPKRFMEEIVRLGVWEEHLSIGNRRWMLAQRHSPVIPPELET